MNIGTILDVQEDLVRGKGIREFSKKRKQQCCASESGKRLEFKRNLGQARMENLEVRWENHIIRSWENCRGHNTEIHVDHA